MANDPFGFELLRFNCTQPSFMMIYFLIVDPGVSCSHNYYDITTFFPTRDSFAHYVRGLFDDVTFDI